MLREDGLLNGPFLKDVDVIDLGKRYPVCA